MGDLIISDLRQEDDLSPEEMKDVNGGTGPTPHVAVRDFSFTRHTDMSSPIIFL
jgi:type VI protein secretion system component Hcp